MRMLFDNEGIYFPEEDINDELYDPTKCTNVYVDLACGKFDNYYDKYYDDDYIYHNDYKYIKNKKIKLSK